MSDIQIVSADAFRNAELEDGRVPYGTVFADEVESADEQTFEGLQGAPAVDWRGIDQVDTQVGPTPKKRGRPRKVKDD